MIHTTPVSRRRLLLGTAALTATATLVGRPAGADAALVLDPDPIRAYEIAWDTVDTSVTDNEGGGLAWGMSYILLSLVRMYEASGDISYLDRFVDRADAVWEQTDRARGVTDWQGRSGEVWRTSGAYTVGGAVITDAEDNELFDIRYGAASAGATVAVSAAGDGTADLTLTHPSTGTVEVPGVSLDPSSPDFVVTRVNNDAYTTGRRWTAKRLDGPDTARPVEGTTELARRFYVFPVHTGMVTYPIAVFARIVLEQGIRKYHALAHRYLAKVQRAVIFHDHEWHWRTLDDGTTGGDYVWPKGAPIPFDGLIQPFNQTQGLGLTMAELHRVRPRAQWADKVEAMVRAFRSDLEQVGRAAQWHYWPTYSELYRSYSADEELSEYTPWFTPATQYEDVSHAAISIEFMSAAHHAGLGSTQNDLETLAATYLDLVRDGDDWVFTRVDGSTTASESIAAQVGRWLSLQQWNDQLAPHVRSVYEAMETEPGSGSHLAGIGYLAWAEREGWDNQ